MFEKPGSEELKKVMKHLDEGHIGTDECRDILETVLLYHRILFDSSSDAVLVFSLRDGRVRDLNSAMLDMFGYDRDEVLSMTADFLGEDNLLALNEKPLCIEKWLPRKDGSSLWVEITVNGVVLGTEPFLFAVIRDTDAHKMAETDLKSQRDRLEYIVEGTSLGTWEWNVQTGETIFNEQWARIVGYTLDELSPTDVNTWKNLVYPEDLERTVGELTAYTTGESDVYDIEFRMVHKDGHPVWIQDRGKVVSRTIDGKALWMYGTHQDISERKRNEEALLREDKKYKSILQTSVDGYWLADLSGKLLEVNDAYCRMSGYSAEELVGMEIARLEGTMTFQEMSRKIDEVLNNELSRFNTKHRKKDGTLYDVEVSVQFLDIEEGKLVMFLRDRSIQTEAARQNKLLQDQLLQAQRLESVGRLAGGVAHDFNNMLSVIIGNAELALDEISSGSSTHGYLTEIFKAARRSSDITRQLLGFARQQTIKPKLLDLNDTVGNMLNMIQRLIGENISLSWMPGSDLPPIRIDPSQLDQILVNLCINSRDAIGNVGRITIETAMERIDPYFSKRHPEFVPGEYIRLSVSDDGSGMDRETLEKIFEPFFTTKGLEKGTGLGLATVYGIIKQNGGFINVYSEPGVGTSFKIYLLYDKSSRIAAIDSDKLRIRGDRAGETILLVEDEPSILKTTSLMLKAMGYSVLGAGSPEEALTLARENSGRIDLLISDVIMPEVNGLDLAKSLQSVCPDMKQLFMSGYTANVVASHDILEEGIHFLPKPFNKDDLFTKVREALDFSGGGSP